MQLIERVNDNDVVIGQSDFNIVHKNLLLHRSVHIFIVDKHGRLFCRKITPKNAIYPGYWSTSAGAHVLLGKGYDETAKEAVKSLLDVKCKLEMIGKLRISDSMENEISATYIGMADKIKTNKEEIEDGRFLTVDEIRNLLKTNKCTPHLLQSLELYLEKKITL